MLVVVRNGLLQSLVGVLVYYKGFGKIFVGKRFWDRVRVGRRRLMRVRCFVFVADERGSPPAAGHCCCREPVSRVGVASGRAGSRDD